MSQKKKKILIILMVIFVTAAIVKIQFFPFGFKERTLLPNTSIFTYKVNFEIHNKYEFIDFLKNNQEEYELGSFMDSNKNVNWDNVQESIKVYRIVWKKAYSLEYITLDQECNKYKIDMTYDGYIKDYRSAGK